MPQREHGALMTADELFDLPDDGLVYELDEGKLICMTPSGPYSSVVAANLHLAVGWFVREHRLGICGVSEGGFKLASNPDTVRAPDVWFVQNERVPPEGLPRSFWALAPDLAIEVLSPTDRYTQVMRKMRDYLNTGVRLIWAIDPEARTAMVFRPGVAPRFIDEDGVLDGEEVLPGLTVKLGDVLM
jgi:Uma2 family endonuclease